MPELVEPGTLAIAGVGAVGEALARAAAARGWSVRVWNRSPLSLAVLERGAEAVPLSVLASGADLVVLSVSEDALEAVARELGAGPRGVAVHTAGARGPEALDGLRAAGWAVGQAHPLAAVARGSKLATDAWWGLSGDAAAVAASTRLVRSLGGQTLALREDRTALYHLAANLVAGGAITLVDLALVALADAVEGADGSPGGEDDARRALASLLLSAARNLDAAGVEAALTGPQARGDAAVVDAHLRALGRLQGADARELEAAYRLLARRMVALAGRRGGVAEGQLAALERLLAQR